MSADWTPPTEAVEAAWPAYWEADTRGDGDVVASALAAAYPAIVAERDTDLEAEVERLHEWREVAVRAHRKLAAVAAILHEWGMTGAAHIDQHDIWTRLRAVLADHAEES